MDVDISLITERSLDKLRRICNYLADRLRLLDKTRWPVGQTIQLQSKTRCEARDIAAAGAALQVGNRDSGRGCRRHDDRLSHPESRIGATVYCGQSHLEAPV